MEYKCFEYCILNIVGFECTKCCFFFVEGILSKIKETSSGSENQRAYIISIKSYMLEEGGEAGYVFPKQVFPHSRCLFNKIKFNYKK